MLPHDRTLLILVVIELYVLAMLFCTSILILVILVVYELRVNYTIRVISP
jgi:hypothetical protein